MITRVGRIILLLATFRSFTVASRPNIVVILTDDQDLVLNSMKFLPKIDKLLAMKGVTFNNAFTSSPICCPSRASILTGLYAHNTQTLNNSRDGGCYSENWVQNHEPTTFPAKLQAAGYETFFAGKYLNQYESESVPVGYSQFFGLHGNSKYYNYTLNENGLLVKYEDSPSDYLTYVVKKRAMEFIQQQTNAKPFFAMLSLSAAHAPFTPEEKYKDVLQNETVPRSRSFNMGSKPFKKHWLMTMEPETLPKSVIETIDMFYHMRLETLMSVDDLVEEVVLQLNKQKLIDDTFIVFTSDNGYHLGQWAMPFDKRLPYETDIKVPMIVRGPNVPVETFINSPVMLLDLAPTILNWAKVSIDYGDYDGIPFDGILAAVSDPEHVEGRQMLIEYWGEGNYETHNPECPYHASQWLSGCTVEAACKCQDSWNNTYFCVRDFGEHHNFIFCLFEDHENYEEAYDLQFDIDQVENVGFAILPSQRAKYQIIIDNLRKCKGDDCRVVK